MNAFSLKILAIIKKIPKGRVATYQQVAALAGNASGPRVVARVLRVAGEEHKLPWQRVISSPGKIAFKPGTRHFKLQALLLRREGVEVDAKNGRVDMRRFQYRRQPRLARSRQQPKMFS